MKRAMVITVSTRIAAGTAIDTSGPALASGLISLGFQVSGPQVVSDGEPLEGALREAISVGYDIVITTGGTGLTPNDRTPEVTDRVIDVPIPGIAEALRAQGIASGIATAMLSRGRAGLAGSTLVINLPGSRGAVTDALTVLGPVLLHAVEQIAGGDPPRA